MTRGSAESYKRWFTYLNERSPLPALIVIAGAQSLAGACLTQTLSPFQFGTFLIPVAGMLIFLILIRLMDELKDYQKDLTAHPERPLARGLISTQEASRGVISLFVLMLLIAGALAIFRSWQSGFFYALTAVYLWLMFREFYIGQSLQKSPFMYAITHQLIVIPLYLFPIAVFDGEFSLGQTAWLYAFYNIGASMSYELGRKLNPNSLPILKQYIVVYGIKKCAVAITLSMVVSAVAAYYAGLAPLLWPIEGLLVISVLYLIINPKPYKAVEAIAAIGSLVHTAAPAIQYFSGWPK